MDSEVRPLRSAFSEVWMSRSVFVSRAEVAAKTIKGQTQREKKGPGVTEKYEPSSKSRIGGLHAGRGGEVHGQLRRTEPQRLRPERTS